VPAEQKTNIIVTIYKKTGDKLQRHSYRGISLLCTGYKIMANCSVTIIQEYHYFAQDTKIMANCSVTIIQEYHYYAQDTNCGKLQCHNYTGISLFCTGYKIMANCSVTIIQEYHYFAQDTKIMANCSVIIIQEYHYYTQDTKLWQITVSQL